MFASTANGYIVGAVTVTDEDTLIVLTTRGKLIQLPAQQVRNTGRIAMGVKLVGLEDGDTVSCIAKVVNGVNEGDTEMDT